MTPVRSLPRLVRRQIGYRIAAADIHRAESGLVERQHFHAMDLCCRRNQRVSLDRVDIQPASGCHQHASPESDVLVDRKDAALVSLENFFQPWAKPGCPGRGAAMSQPCLSVGDLR
jgi:hypothetical protein